MGELLFDDMVQKMVPYKVIIRKYVIIDTQDIKLEVCPSIIKCILNFFRVLLLLGYVIFLGR